LKYNQPISFKQRLQSGVPQIGIRTQLCSPIAVEALGFCGFDFVYIDMEHAPNNLMLVLQQCQAVAGTPAVPLVRLPANDIVLIQQLLDVGIENLVIPMVETAEDAKAAASAIRFPPKGIRSVAGVHRGNQYGALQNYNEIVDDRISLIVQLESRAAIGRVAEISRVDGVAGVLFGPADLAADFGFIGQNEHPDVRKAMEKAILEIRAAGKFAGMSTGEPARGRDWIAKGCSFVSVGGDVKMLTTAARHAAAASRVDAAQ